MNGLLTVFNVLFFDGPEISIGRNRKAGAEKRLSDHLLPKKVG